MPWLSCIFSNIVLASLVALAAWFVERRLGRPAIAHILWVLALVKLVTPPMVSVPVVEVPGTVACALGACHCGQHTPAITFVRSTLPLGLLGAWSAGAVAASWTAWRRWTQFQRLLAHASPAPPRWQSLAARVAAELSIRRPPEVLAVEGSLPPLVVPGWRRPRLLLPMALMDRLDASQRRTLVLHELLHIKRGDHLMRILELAVSVAFWWLPAVRSIGRRLRTCEEACCDAAVVARLPRARRHYARLLLDVVDFADPVPPQTLPQATAMSAAEGLEQRLRAILHPRRPAHTGWASTALVTGLALAILPCGLHYDFAAPPQIRQLSDDCEPPAGKELEVYRCPTFIRPAALCCPSR